MVATSALLSIGRLDIDDPLSSLVKYGQLGWRFEILVNNVPPASIIVLPAAGLEDVEMERRVLTTLLWTPTNEEMRQARRAMGEFRQLLSLWHRYSIVLGPTETATEVIYLVNPHLGRQLWPDEDDSWRIFLLGRNIPSLPQHPDEATPDYVHPSASAEELMQAVFDMIMEKSTPDHLIMYEEMIEARVAEIYTLADMPPAP